MFGIGGFELLLIIVFVLLVFGPDKLPEIGKLVGRGIRMFNDARHEVESVVRTEILRPEDIEAFGTITGKRPYTPRAKASASPVKDAVSAQRELEAKREAEAARIEAERAASAAAAPTPAGDAASLASAATASRAVAEAQARAAEAAKRAADAEAIAAEAALAAAEAEAAAAAAAAEQSE